MKKIVLVIAQKGFRGEELFEPKEVLRQNNIDPKVASKTKETAFGHTDQGEVESQPDLSIDQIKVEDFDGIVFVGGSGAEMYLNDSQVHQLIKDFNSAGKLVGAICFSTSILAEAGILEGKKITAHASRTEHLKSKGLESTGNPVEVDGNIITANGPAAAKDFGQALADYLNS